VEGVDKPWTAHAAHNLTTPSNGSAPFFAAKHRRWWVGPVRVRNGREAKPSVGGRGCKPVGRGWGGKAPATGGQAPPVGGHLKGSRKALSPLAELAHLDHKKARHF